MARIVWLHARPVYPARGGAEIRCAGLIALAQSLGHEVLLVTPVSADASPAPSGIETLQLRTRSGPTKWVAKIMSRAPLRAPSVARRDIRAARNTVKDFAPDVVVASDLLVWGFADHMVAAAPWIYDAHNVEHLLWKSHRDGASHPLVRLTYVVDHRRVRRLERRLLKTAAAVMSVSQIDRDTLAALGDRPRIDVVPNSVVTPTSTAKPEAAQRVILFVGTLSYPPNVEAVTELIERVMPLVLVRIPDARLRLVGRRASPAIRELAEKSEFIDLFEDVADIGEQYRSARCVVIPMKSGSGTNVKLFEALSYGVPVVCTPKAIEGVDVADGDGVRIHEDTAGLASSASRLLEDPAMSAEVGALGRQHFVERLSWDGAVKAPLRVVLDDCVSLSS